MMRTQATDKGFYAPTPVGKTRTMTPEGYLLCEEVPIARTGTQIYNIWEILDDDGKPGLKGDQTGTVIVTRSAEQVFRPETIASFNGKSVTIDHPERFVKPENWKTLTVGTVHNARRGRGINDDLLVADLLITDPEAIKVINDELPEVSAGYDAGYTQDNGPGYAEQTGITGNHVAILKGGRGRAGPRCAVKDSTEEFDYMKIRDMLFGAKTPADVATVLDSDVPTTAAGSVQAIPGISFHTGDGAGNASVMKALDALTASVTALTADVAKMKDKKTKDDEEDGDGDAETTDADGNDLTVPKTAGKVDLGKIYGTGDARSSINSQAEVLAPGIVLPTSGKVGSQTVVDFMRTALSRAHTRDEASKKSVETMLAGRKINALTGDALATVFRGAATLVAALNTATTAPSGSPRLAANDKGSPQMTPAMMNKAAAEFWK